jgi:hypothetical protein
MKIISTCFLLSFSCAAVNLSAQQISSSQDQVAKALLSPAATAIRSDNAVIAVQVRTSNDTLTGGQIRRKGVFNIGTFDNKPLLYLFPQEPYTSHFNVRVDGTVYSNDPFRTGVQNLPLLLDPVLLPDSTITCTYQVGLVTIEQRLKPLQFSSTTGAIFIQYIITNNDAVAHQVGLLLELDTTINGNDAAPISTSFGYSRREQQFNAPFIPDYFQAFEKNDLVSPGLVAQGTLIGRDAVRPDVVIIGDWSNLSRVQWDYVLPNQFYNDSAVILRWNETLVSPGARRVFATYYGIGDVTTANGQLALNLTAPNRLDAVVGQLTPNPFEVNLIVFNTGAATAANVQATLTLPTGLTFASGDLASKLVSPNSLAPLQSGTASWKVLAQCPDKEDTLDLIVDVTSSNAAANSVSRKITLASCAASLPNFVLTASPPSDTVVAGQAASYTIRLQTSGGFASNVGLSLFPTIPSVVPTFAPDSINAATTSALTLQTATTLAPGNYHFVIAGNGGGLTRNDTVMLVVQAPPLEDKTPPFTTNHNPARGAGNVPLNTDIVVEVYDAQLGVDSTSLQMNVVDVSGTTSVTRIGSAPKSYRLRFQPSTPFRDNQIVQVQINAADLASPPNSLQPPDAYSFTTILDGAPPFTLNHFPARSATQVPVDTKIEVRLRDLLTGVDRDSILMRVNGSVVNPIISGDSLEYLLSYQPPVKFRLNDTVRVQIEATDLAATPNRMPPDSYEFFTARDEKPPFTINHYPARGATNVPPNTAIAVEVRDDLSGVDSASIVVKINGDFTQFNLQRGTSGYVVSFRPSVPFALNDTVRVSIDANDRAVPPNVMRTEHYYFVTQRDVAPPFAAGHRPAKGATNVPLDAEIYIEVRDELAGVDRTSLTMEMNGQLVQPLLITPILQGFVLQYKPTPGFHYNETVQVVVRARDLAQPANIMPPDTLRFSTIRDVEPPFTTDHQPARGSSSASPNTNISLHVRDFVAGVDSAAIAMAVNGIKVSPAITGTPQDFKLEYDPLQNFAPGDTVRVSIDAADLAVPPNVMPTDHYFFVLAKVKDTSPPFATGHRPAKGATNVPLDAEIYIEVRDELAGVDRTSLTMELNGQVVQPLLITPILQGFVLQFKLTPGFHYNETVQVVVRARDLAQPANVMAPDTLRFSTIRDVEPPFTTDHQPAKGSSNASPNTNISLHVHDFVAGVDSAAIAMTVNGTMVSPAITGAPQNFKLEYDPLQNFAPGDTVSVSIDAQDLSSPPNTMPRETYAFVIGQELPDLAVMSLQPKGTFFIGQQGEVIGKITNAGSADASRAFNVQFRVDGGIRKDTTFTQLAASDSATMLLPLRFETTGTHEVELIVDVDKEIREVIEANNSQKLVVQISQSPALANRLIARPNPFTPNNDGYNDQIEFNYSGLGLRNPSLQIFDVNGISVWSSHNGVDNRFIWNGRDDRGREVLPGVYLYSVREQGNNVASGYVVVAR